MRYHSVAVANRFIELWRQDGKKKSQRIDFLKLVKLVYFAHGFMLAWHDRELCQEAMEAWDHGAIPPSVYYYFKDNGRSAIRRPSKAHDFNLGYAVFPSKISEDDEQAFEVTKDVWRIFKKFSPTEISALARQKNGAWDKVKTERGGEIYQNEHIPNELIKEEIKHYID